MSWIRASIRRSRWSPVLGAAFAIGALFLLPIGLGVVSPRSRHAVEPPGAPLSPECEPPPSRLATPRPPDPLGRSSERVSSARGTAHWAADAAGTPCAPSPASTEHLAPLARLEVRVLGLGFGESGTLELLHEPADGTAARRTRLATDREGLATLDLAPGSVRVVAWGRHATAAPARAELALDATTRLELALEPALPLLGCVRDAGTGAPVAGASVRLWTFAETDVAVTGPDGTFRHPRFPRRAPMQQIAANASGYGTSVRCLGLDEDGSWKLAARHAGETGTRGTGTPWIELELVPERRLAGRVLGPNGAPQAGVRVVAEGFQRVLTSVASRDAAETVTRADGSFELAGLRSDLGHALLLEAPGFAFEPRELAPAAGSCLLGDLVLQPARSLAGAVIDAAGHPVAEIEVVLRFDGPLPTNTSALDAGARVASRERRAVTSPEGAFAFEGLHAAGVWLGVEREDGARSEVVLEPLPDGTYDAPCLVLGPAPAVAQHTR